MLVQVKDPTTGSTDLTVTEFDITSNGLVRGISGGIGMFSNGLGLGIDPGWVGTSACSTGPFPAHMVESSSELSPLPQFRLLLQTWPQSKHLPL